MSYANTVTLPITVLNMCIQLQTSHHKSTITYWSYTGCNTFTYKMLRDTLKIIPLYMTTTGHCGILFNIDKTKLRLHTVKKGCMESWWLQWKSLSIHLLDNSRDNVLSVSSAAPDTHNHTTSQPYCRKVTNLKNSRNTATAPCHK